MKILLSMCHVVANLAESDFRFVLKIFCMLHDALVAKFGEDYRFILIQS